jgi:Mg2+/Co2+ transporter CorB
MNMALFYGLVTIEDIVEELIGEFTTSLPSLSNKSTWLEDGTYLANGKANLRDLNRLLGLNLPLHGPRTLNGLLLDVLQEIPDHDVSVKIADCVMEIIQFDQQSIKTVRIHQPIQAHHENSNLVLHARRATYYLSMAGNFRAGSDRK